MSGNNILEIKDVYKTFRVGVQDIKILKNINFNILEGDFLVIFGPSGCGKSTLLHTLLGLEPPSSGEVVFLGTNLYQNKTEDDRSDIRKKDIGMIYQQPNWIKSLKVKENVAFPLTLLGTSNAEAINKAYEVLEKVSMLEWADHVPTELSSGQQQRVSLARALINNPRLIVADEPTGNLDYESGQDIMKLFSSLNVNDKKTIVMVTHDLEYLRYTKSAVRMFDGEVIGIYSEKEKEKLMQELKSKRFVDTKIGVKKSNDHKDDRPKK